MSVIGRCDNAKCHRESLARVVGVTYRIPAGWSIVADGPVKTRSVEFLACSEPCIDALVAPLSNAIKMRLFIKTAAGEREILPTFDGAQCELCAVVGKDECAVHGTWAQEQAHV